MPDNRRSSHSMPPRSPRGNGGKSTYKRRRRKKGAALPITIICLALVACLAVGLVFALWGNQPGGSVVSSSGGSAPSGSASLPASSLPQASSSIPEPKPVDLKVRFSAVGDNLVNEPIFLTGREHAGENEAYNFTSCFEPMEVFLAEHDVNWINQETLINSEYGATGYPYFSTPTEMGSALYNAGWRVFGLSNNHTYDYRAGGIAATLRFWESMPEDVVTTGLFTGNEDDSGIGIHEVNGITIAYVSFTEHVNGNPQPADAEAYVICSNDPFFAHHNNLQAMEFKVRRAKELADAVIVGMHWGVEGSHTVTDAQRSLAADFAAWGADVVVGTHPHVVQTVEWIEDPTDGSQTLVAYSLGNFLSAQYTVANNMLGLALTFDIEQTVDPDGTRHPVTITNAKAFPTVTHYDWGSTNVHNVRTYLLQDYTAEMALQHAVIGRIPQFNMDYILNVFTSAVSEDFLVLD